MSELSFISRVKNAVNVFRNRNPNSNYIGQSFAVNPDRVVLTGGNGDSIINPVINRIALDASGIQLRHAKMDENGQFLKVIDSSLQRCLTVSANIDQAARAFRKNIYLTMFDAGSVAVVPTDWDGPRNAPISECDILELRVGKVIEWSSDFVRVDLYNHSKGDHEEIVLRKENVAIIENPFYTVMNEKNSIASKIVRKMTLLDVIDDRIGANKLDLIIQFPYAIKSENKVKLANDRVAQIEEQLNNHRYGIAYIDGTEKITQLNRPVENNLMAEITELKNMLYSQLGMTEEILNGTADSDVMNNYMNRIVEPCVDAVKEELHRKFLSLDQREKKHEAIIYFTDPFRLLAVDKLAEAADKYIRNTIMTPNEFRTVLGLAPSDNPQSDELKNPNIAESKQPDPQAMPGATGEQQTDASSQEDPKQKLVKDIAKSKST